MISIKDGQARIEGKEHLNAEMVARLSVDGEATVEDVMAQYGLTAAEVQAAIAYYSENQAELDAAHQTVLAEIHQNAMNMDKFKVKIAAKK